VRRSDGIARPAGPAASRSLMATMASAPENSPSCPRGRSRSGRSRRGRARQTVVDAQSAPSAARTTTINPIPAQESISFFIVQPPTVARALDRAGARSPPPSAGSGAATLATVRRRHHRAGRPRRSAAQVQRGSSARPSSAATNSGAWSATSPSRSSARTGSSLLRCPCAAMRPWADTHVSISATRSRP